MIWIALAPLPITATRLPASSTSCRQRDEWNAGPSNEPSPGRFGIFGTCSAPTADTTTRAVNRRPSRAVSRHLTADSSHSIRSIGVS